MTLQEFRETCCDSVNSLMAFVSDNELWEYIDDTIVDDSYKDESLDQWVRETDCSWEEIRDILSNVPTGYDYYWTNGWTDYEGLSNRYPEDIDRVRELIEDAMAGQWDDEESEEDEEGDVFVEEEAGVEEEMVFEIEDFECEQMFTNCKNELRPVGNDDFETHLFNMI